MNIFKFEKLFFLANDNNDNKNIRFDCIMFHWKYQNPGIFGVEETEFF